MSGPQFWRLFFILNLLAVVISGFLIKRDIEAIYAPRAYAYDPWSALPRSRELVLEAVEGVAVEEVFPGYEDYLLRTYRSHGYRACPMGGAEYLEVCFEHEVGFGRIGITYPANGHIEDLSTMTFPILGKDADGDTQVFDRPVYDAKGNNREEIHDAIAAITRRAETRYRADVSREIGNRFPFWLLAAFGPGVLMLFLFAGYRWVRFGSLKA